MTIDEIIAQTVAYLKTLPDGTEIATSDALKASCGFDFDPNGEYLVGNTPVDFEGMFSLDRDIRKAARKAGLKIDDSLYADQVVGLLFNVPYIVKKRTRR
jgi:hypothetical protein